MAYTYSQEELIMVREAGLTTGQVDAVIDQFLNKGVMPLDCSLQLLKMQERGESTTGFLSTVEASYQNALLNNVDLTPYLDVGITNVTTASDLNAAGFAAGVAGGVAGVAEMI